MEYNYMNTKEESGFFSNLSKHPIIYNGQQYISSEALFQYMRYEGCPEVQKEITESTAPIGPKLIAQKYSELLNRGEKWDEAVEDIEVMRLCLKLKIEQYPEIKKMLLETGDDEIVENRSTCPMNGGKFWGKVYNYKNGNWEGENVLGKLWMELRDQLKLSTTLS